MEDNTVAVLNFAYRISVSHWRVGCSHANTILSSRNIVLLSSPLYEIAHLGEMKPQSVL